MQEVTCPHCSYRWAPECVRCSYPPQVDCIKCGEMFWLDDHGHSGKERSDIPGHGGFPLDAPIYEEIGDVIINPKNIKDVKFE